MAGKSTFPPLTPWDETRETLHAYAKVLGAIRAAFSPPQPRHEHTSLRLYTAGLTTTPIPHPLNSSRSFSLSLDLRNHYVLLSTSEGEVQQWRISEGLSANKLAEQLSAKLAEMDVQGKLNKRKYASDRPHSYALDEAERYFAVLSQAGRLLEEWRGELGGESTALQVWPKLFDLSFALLGNKTVKIADGEQQSQILFGFAPAARGLPGAYFFANPLPFDESLLAQPLPEGASWHTAGWEGAMLPYAEVAGSPDAAARILAFLRGAYELQKQLVASKS
ncbi:MAG: hypothetical protein KIS85_09850 [Anaerolineales bacterium]|nr:hypothetical protein [Anaerolineales bacterium]